MPDIFNCMRAEDSSMWWALCYHETVLELFPSSKWDGLGSCRQGGPWSETLVLYPPKFDGRAGTHHAYICSMTGWLELTQLYVEWWCHIVHTVITPALKTRTRQLGWVLESYEFTRTLDLCLPLTYGSDGAHAAGVFTLTCWQMLSLKPERGYKAEVIHAMMAGVLGTARAGNEFD